MTRGGARVRSGPAKDPQAQRRDRDDWNPRLLPSAGRDGDPPAWPLDGQRERERILWAEEWRRPQAVAWERLGLQLEAALYVRNLVDAEQSGAGPTTRRLLLSQMDSLGLTVAGMTRNGWAIDDAGGAASEPAAQPVPARDSRRRSDLALVVNR